MKEALARTLMEEFADATGITGKTSPRRYLWTDAFAVCNFLGVYRQTGDDRYLGLSRELVEQVHHILGRHRDDDPRRGWISGLSEGEGEQHPTSGGLRIGKRLNERGPHEASDAHLEWDQDGQYFHYLTRWMHALCRMGQETNESCYHRWAVELAITTHRAFTRQLIVGGPKQIAWKMSIDLSRPLVTSTGQHDPLDGLVTYLELQAVSKPLPEERADLSLAIADMTMMCTQARWATDDPLGIGGLLEAATRLAQLALKYDVDRHELVHRVLANAEFSLRQFSRSSLLSHSAEHRLAFRELGLSIGVQGLPIISETLPSHRQLAEIYDRLLPYQPLVEQIQSFWSEPQHRQSSAWKDHRDINTVMLATSFAPKGYLTLKERGCD